MLLTSHVEANPVSILEALAVGKPVVATRVGSIAQSVLDREMGPGRAGRRGPMAGHVVELFRQPKLAAALGAAGRQHVVAHWSLDRMVEGYEELLEQLFDCGGRLSDRVPLLALSSSVRRPLACM